MPERMIVYNDKLCKYAPDKKKGEVIKITGVTRKKSKPDDRAIKREVYKKKDVGFQDFLMYVTKDESDRLDKFTDYCMIINKCVHCGQTHQWANFACDDDDNITMTCKDGCMGVTKDETKEGKDYVRWFNKLLEPYAMSFKDGFPPAIKAQYGTKCDHCGGSHDGAVIWFDFT